MAKVDEFDRCIGNSGSYAAVRQRLEEIVVAQQKAYEQLQRSTGILSDAVSLDQCAAIVNQLEEERKEHSKTRAQLVEVQDKLELALGEVDILRKQIEREKAQFEQAFADLKTLKQPTKASRQRAGLAAESSRRMNLDLRAAGVADSDTRLTWQLGGRSSDTTSTHRPAAVNSDMTSGRQQANYSTDSVTSGGVMTSASERDIELQQQLYISRLMDSKSSSSSSSSSTRTGARHCSLASRSTAARGLTKHPVNPADDESSSQTTARFTLTHSIF